MKSLTLYRSPPVRATSWCLLHRNNMNISRVLKKYNEVAVYSSDIRHTQMCVSRGVLTNNTLLVIKLYCLIVATPFSVEVEVGIEYY